MVKYRFQTYYRITFCLAVFSVFVLSVIPHPESITGDMNDKINHVLAFSVLAFLALQGFETRIRLIIVYLAAYGILIELVQFLIPSRRCSFLDFCADLCGIGAGLFVNAVFVSIKNRREGSKKR